MAEHLAICLDASGRWRWRHKAANHRITGASEQGYRWRRYAIFKAKRAYPGVPYYIVGVC